MERKVLVTGASGLIGRELCKQLSAYFQVTGVDNNFRYNYTPEGIQFVRQDIINFVNENSNNFDYIFHMAAINGTKYFYDIPNELLENNITTDLAIFNYAKTNPSCKLIYGSSSEIVAGTETFPTPEINDITVYNLHNPRWSYRLSKMVSENYLVNSNINYLIIRFFNIFGSASASGHFVRDILNKLENNDYTLIGESETRSFCRVEDAVDALVNIFKIASNDIVNIGSDEEITVLEAANIIAEHKGLTAEWIFLPSNSGSVARRKPDITKLLYYYPSFNPAKFKDAIKDI